MTNQEAAFLTVEKKASGEAVLFFSGSLTIHTAMSLLPRMEAFWKMEAPERVLVDLSGLRCLDTVGALLLRKMEEESGKRSLTLEYRGVSDSLSGTLRMVPREYGESRDVSRRQPSLVEGIGEEAVHFFTDIIEITTFVGDLVKALASVCLRFRSVRWKDVLHYMKRAGVDGLPIVGLISFLLGLIMAFMSSLQLKQFGANIFVASLVGIALVRELGPIMTAILVAGRSGSAYAAEIGTMVVNEEVDALTTMGFEPVSFLTVPKVLATILVVPLLTLYADFFGIAGGLVVGITGLDLTVHSYVQQTMNSITLFDVFSSLFKSVVFAVIIAGIGCQRGLKVGRGAEGVGASATSAVVSAIFLIIVTDSAFAILLHYVH